MARMNWAKAKRPNPEYGSDFKRDNSRKISQETRDWAAGIRARTRKLRTRNTCPVQNQEWADYLRAGIDHLK